MFKTISSACFIAATNAIKLEATKFLALDDLSAYSTSTNAGNAIRTAGTKWLDPAFPPNDESHGNVGGDSAAGAAGSQSASVSWKRLSEIYPKEDLKVFANKETFSSAEQGQIGDCYFISTMV